VEYLTEWPSVLESVRQALLIVFGACCFGLTMESIDALKRARAAARVPATGPGRRA
jgi:hypothetical protein